MKKILIIVSLLLLFSGCKKNENELIMVTEAGFAPYEYYENGEIVGIDVDIAEEIAKELGKTLVIKDIAFDSIISEVKTGKADFGAAGISYSEERNKEVDFSNDYVISRQVAVVRKDSNIINLNQISNKKIVVQLGSVADSILTEKYPNSEITRQKKYLAAAQDVKDKKVDVLVMDELPAKEIVKNNTELKILNGEIASDSYGIVVQKGNTELLETINKVIDRLIDEGKIDEFSLKHMNN